MCLSGRSRAKPALTSSSSAPGDAAGPVTAAHLSGFEVKDV